MKKFHQKEGKANFNALLKEFLKHDKLEKIYIVGSKQNIELFALPEEKPPSIPNPDKVVLLTTKPNRKKEFTQIVSYKDNPRFIQLFTRGGAHVMNTWLTIRDLKLIMENWKDMVEDVHNVRPRIRLRFPKKHSGRMKRGWEKGLKRKPRWWLKY